MAKLLRCVRGTRDLFPADCARHHAVASVFRDAVQAMGFAEVRTPIMEPTAVFLRSLGLQSDVVSKEMFLVKSRGDAVCLRPEATAAVARALMEGELLHSGPHRLYYSGPMFRHERPQKGRYRQFEQFGVECIGVDHALCDVEVMQCAHTALSTLRLPGKLVLEVNSLGDSDSRERYHTVLAEYLGQHRSGLSPDSVARLDRGSALRVLDSKSPQDAAIVAGAPVISSFLSPAAAGRFESVLKGLEQAGIPYSINNTLVRGLDYYCHTIFEFKVEADGAEVASRPLVPTTSSTPAPAHADGDDEGEGGEDLSEGGSGGGDLGRLGTVLAGGRYDGLFQQLGGPLGVPGIGWAAGIDRLALLAGLEVPKPPAAVLVIPVLGGGAEEGAQAVELYSARVARQLRLAGVPAVCEWSRRNLKKVLAKVNKEGLYTTVVLVGSTEMQSESVTLRCLAAGSQEVVPLSALHARVQVLALAKSGPK